MEMIEMTWRTWVQIRQHEPRPPSFFTAFVITFGEIFLECSLNILEKIFKKIFRTFFLIHTILLRFMFKINEKCHFQKN
jgi:hypothetical protein